MGAYTVLRLSWIGIRLFLTNFSLIFLIIMSFVFAIMWLFGMYTIDVARIIGTLSLLYSLISVESKLLKHQQQTFFKKISKIASFFYKKPLLLFPLFFLILFLCYGLNGFKIKYLFGFDTSIFLQALTHSFDAKTPFYITIELCGKSFLTNHFSPYLALLYPIQFIPYPNVILYALNYLSLTGVFYIAYKILNDNITLPILGKYALLIALLGHPFLNGMISYEYHETNLIMFFHMLLFYSFLKKKLRWFIITAAFSLLLKETVIFSFLFWGVIGGLYTVTQKRNWQYPLTLFISGIVGYVVYFLLIRPIVAEGSSSTTYIAIFRLTNLGTTNLEILLSPLLKPEAFFAKIFILENLIYLIFILGPVLPFAIFSPAPLFFLFPSLCYGLIFGELMRNPNWHYFGELFMPLFAAGYFGMIAMKKRKLPRRYLNFVLGFSIFVFAMTLRSSPIRSVIKLYKERDNVIFTNQLTHLPPAKTCALVNDRSLYPFIATKSLVYEAQLLSFEKQDALNCDYIFERSTLSDVFDPRLFEDKELLMTFHFDKEKTYRVWRNKKNAY